MFLAQIYFCFERSLHGLHVLIGTACVCEILRYAMFWFVSCWLLGQLLNLVYAIEYWLVISVSVISSCCYELLTHPVMNYMQVQECSISNLHGQLGYAFLVNFIYLFLYTSCNKNSLTPISTCIHPCMHSLLISPSSPGSPARPTYRQIGKQCTCLVSSSPVFV